MQHAQIMLAQEGRGDTGLLKIANKGEGSVKGMLPLGGDFWVKSRVETNVRFCIKLLVRNSSMSSSMRSSVSSNCKTNTFKTYGGKVF